MTARAPAERSTDQALTETEFAALMARLGPFGPAPRIAVAVSGGPDSMALALLLNDWAAAREGALIGLIVDHRLRPESAAEARQVAAALGSLGIRHKILTRRGPKPSANVQAAARTARYDLLTAHCARERVLFLALGHHLDDQAETLLLRLGRGSGLDGLSGMPARSESAELCQIRPLLGIPKARLASTLRERGLGWVEDPSNRDPQHARVRIRALAPALAHEGLTAERLAAAAGHLGRGRASLELAVASLLAKAALLHPAGFLWLDPTAIAGAADEVGLRALARALRTVGGGTYTVRMERLERLYERIVGGLSSGATLGGCRVLPRKGGLLIAREPAAAPAVALGTQRVLLWDGRFQVKLGQSKAVAGKGLTIGPLGSAGWRDLVQADASQRDGPVPAPARVALPALRDPRGIAAVPQLGFWRDSKVRRAVNECRFAPKNPLVPPGFTVAYTSRHIIS